MASAEFLFYPRLPNELKAMIWEYAFAEWSSGAHRFRLFIDPRSPTKLVLRPDNDQKDDASAWRERLALARIDACSRYVFSKLQHEAKKRNQLKLLYKDTLYNRRRRLEENGVAANIVADTDLVTFRFNYGASQASLALLSHVENKEVFAGITQVGIEVELLQRGYMKVRRYKPFRFQCNQRNHSHQPEICPDGVVNFLRWFKDLKTVYIIFSLKRSGRHRQNNVVSTRDIFQVLQNNAQQVGFKQFHGRKGTYCQVSRPPSGFFTASELLSPVTLYSAWTLFHQAQQSAQRNWESVQFGVLCWLN